MLTQHLYSLVLHQRVAIANGFGWQRFLNMVGQAMLKKCSTLELPLNNASVFPAPI